MASHKSIDSDICSRWVLVGVTITMKPWAQRQDKEERVHLIFLSHLSLSLKEIRTETQTGPEPGGRK